MRTELKQQSKPIRISESVYQRLVKDKAHFQKDIGGGKWSISDTISEYFKIMEHLKTKR